MPADDIIQNDPVAFGKFQGRWQDFWDNFERHILYKQPLPEGSFDPAGHHVMRRTVEAGETHASAAAASTPSSTLPDPTGTEGGTVVVFVDSTVPSYADLVDQAPPGVEVVVFDGSVDGVAQITAFLSGRTGIDAVHIVSEGGAGLVRLGTTLLTLRIAGSLFWRYRFVVLGA